MYQAREDAETAYILGNRMLSFLTECLPNHPGFHKPSTAALRKESFKQLKRLQSCMDDLAQRIDEEQADSFADNFDPLRNTSLDYDSGDDDIPQDAANGWVMFSNALKAKEQRAVESPTSTIETTGSGSFDVSDQSSSEDDAVERRIHFSEYDIDSSSSASTLVFVELGTEFLEKIAEEEVQYESDSEAKDSWAQGYSEDESSRSSSVEFQRHGIVCDPARLAFGGSKGNQGNHQSLTSNQLDRNDTTERTPTDILRARPDPPAEILRVTSNETVEDVVFESFVADSEDQGSFVMQSQSFLSGELKSAPGDRSLSFREKSLSPERKALDQSDTSHSTHSDQVEFVCLKDNHMETSRPFRRYECPRESAVMSEIQKFLDASFEYDPSAVFQTSLERLGPKMRLESMVDRNDSSCPSVIVEEFPQSLVDLSVPNDMQNTEWVAFD